MLSVFISQSPFHIFASSFSYGMIRTHRFKKLANPKNPISSTDLRSEPQARKKKKKKTGHCPKSKPATDPPTQIAQLSPSSSSDGFTILPKEFFLVDALDLAPRLLGKLIRRDDVVLRITEVEAYRPNDSACHGRFGVTARTAPVVSPVIVLGKLEILTVGDDSEAERSDNRQACSSYWSREGGLELLDAPKPESILVGPRVGIEYALPEHVNALWRFAIAGTPWISAPKNTLRPS
uniref:DNA-3-methyladenine glycosylase II n=1 Tax=Cucumis melo TaxID=3656 RepID=A0A9I9CWU8_CUCME